jgi:hypothetical protein
MVSAWKILVDLSAKDGIPVDMEMHARCVCHFLNIVVRLFMKEMAQTRAKMRMNLNFMPGSRRSLRARHQHCAVSEIL